MKSIFHEGFQGARLCYQQINLTAWFNGAIVFLAFGLALGPFGLGLPAGLGFMDMVVDTELLRSLAELTLGLVLLPMHPTRILLCSKTVSAYLDVCY